MLLLAVDTSGSQGGITLARGNDDKIEIIESASIQGGTFSAELIPQISALLRRHQLVPQQLQGLIAVTGPGSFTGLRVGLTAVKGLAEVLKIPIASVSSLDLLLSASSDDRAVMAVIDAGRGEVYVAIYFSNTELLMPLDEAIALSRSRNWRVLTSEAHMAAKFDSAQVVTERNTEVAARNGYARLVAGATVDVLALDANYIRRSEAEYMQKLKHSLGDSLANMKITPANASAIPSILSIQQASLSASQWSYEYYAAATSKPDRLVLIAEQDSKVVGFVVVSNAIPEWELENIAVAPDSRKRGIGRALLSSLIDLARKSGATEIRQEIRESNKAAQSLGLSVGFIHEGRRRDYYRDPVEDALLLKHLLGRQ